MAEYIEREAAIKLLHYNADESCSSVIADFEALPAANVEPVVHGKWIHDRKEHVHCSNCGDGRNIRTQIAWKFCPSCGAKMQEAR